MSEAGLLATLTAAAALVTAGVTAAVTFLAARRQQRQQDVDDAIKRYQVLVERQDAHLEDLSRAVDQLAEEHLSCQVSMAEMYGHLQRLHDLSCRFAKLLGLEAEKEVPALPPRPPRPEPAEFRKRSLQQNTQLLKQQAHDSTVLPPRSLPQDPPGAGGAR